MTAKEYLMQIQYCDTIIKVNNSQIEDMRLKIIPGGSIDYSADRVQTSPEDYFAERMAEYVDDIKPLEEENNYCKAQRKKIIEEIKSLSNHNYIELLYKRYVEGKKIRQIAYIRWMSAFVNRNDVVNYRSHRISCVLDRHIYRLATYATYCLCC